MDFAKRKKFNLKVLQRHDPMICEILDQSPHGVMYKFAVERISWERMDYEGVLFLVKRRSPPEYALFILNRHKIDNFVIYLNEISKLQDNDEFMFFSNKNDEILALWLFEEKDRKRITTKVSKLRSQVGSAQKEDKEDQDVVVDVVQLLQRAVRRPALDEENYPPAAAAVDGGPPPHPQNGGENPLLKVLKGSQQQRNGEQPPPPAMAMPEPPKNQNQQQLLSIFQQSPVHSVAHLPPISTPQQKAASLLQTLQGGLRTDTPPSSNLAAAPLPPPPPPPPPMSVMNGVPPPPPLAPQHAVELSQGEVLRRFGGGPMLSKPEFIQQFMNIVHNDPLFFDHLYSSYQASRQQQQQQQAAAVDNHPMHNQQQWP
ncbi:hypothetical protein VTP01DRAFT_8495 [Rhizomucor pusillus]|uniref:uncharacterized protein n=1 Tax=Rhizomucor pusillus TaxID=4840 RepID=UPI00374272AB